MSGATLVPVCPTWSECGRQPALVTAREQPTAPPSSAASSSITAKPSAEPTPRPPETTTFASSSETPPRRRADPLGRRDAPDRADRPRRPRHRLPIVSAATACGATVISSVGAVQQRLLEQAAAPAHARHRRRVSGLQRVVLADSGRSRIAAVCASTSLPRSLPGATSAAGWRALDQVGQRLAPGGRRVIA